jgi:hypothetical protein
MQRTTTTEEATASKVKHLEMEIEERERKKIALATEGFTSNIRRYETILRDRPQLSREATLTVSSSFTRPLSNVAAPL